MTLILSPLIPGNIGERWRHLLSRSGAAMLVVSLLSGCATGFHDGMRVTDRTTPVRMEGYILKPGTSGAQVRVYARNFSTGRYDVVATTAGTTGRIANRVSYTMNDGTKLYSWNLGTRALGSAYWRSGTGGFYARIRAEWYDSDGEQVATLMNSRADSEGCFSEDRNGEANTTGYISKNCFSHRKDAYIYTQNYRQGPASCAPPAASLARIHGHYMLENVPGCAQSYIRARFAERVDRAMIDDHHEIDHVSGPNAFRVNETGGFRVGGFFGGHENYLRMMKRHVMVYDYPWMPRGEIPAWRPDTTIPAIWRTAVASPLGNCYSMDMECDGWLSGSVANSSPNIPTPSTLRPGNVCQYATTEALFNRVRTWHANVHVTVGGSFRTMDSPSFPIFFPWHTYVQDVWLDWKACGHAGP